MLWQTCLVLDTSDKASEAEKNEMTISPDLFRAILAMDAYNRGYNAGLTNLSDTVGTQIGNAFVLARSDSTPGSDPVNAGFYAIAYDVGAVSGFSAGEELVSYRGTDGLFGTGAPNIPSGSDLMNGYGVGAGSPFGAQAALAVEFYKNRSQLNGRYATLPG